MSRQIIGSQEADTGERLVHQAGGLGDYGTLCGLSLDDDQFTEFVPPARARINCANCKSVWLAARQLCSADFTKETT